MATLTIINANPTLRNLRAILSRVDAAYDLVWTQDKNCVHGNTITAQIDFEDSPFDKSRKPVSVTISSSYYSDNTLEQLAEKVKGKGWISHENGKPVHYEIDFFIGRAAYSEPFQTEHYNTYAEAEKVVNAYEGGEPVRAYKVVDGERFDMFTGELIEEMEES